MEIISVVKIEMFKEKNLMVENKKITSPRVAYEIAREYLKNVDREYLIVMAVNTKN
ncbi:hypothetical protein [Clostridium estertheticum]|uniref:hypothetical protein n=1 Tax=Clostridium estertheticum TaxID=238834 RepID=UPI001C0AB1A5|nr:hypothetical protein [Clostridium estertheticum]MBU3173408.1 hypothetical protein [Clostridium estertheticum]